jgi:hypothetical protein
MYINNATDLKTIMTAVHEKKKPTLISGFFYDGYFPPII